MGVFRSAAAAFIAVATLAAIAPARAAPPDEGRRQELLASLARISAASGGTLGVSALHLASGDRVQLNGGERFPMASTFKVAVAVKLLHEVDRILGLEMGADDYLTKPFSANELMQRTLEAMRWIDYARVERAWPDGLRVMVTEQVAVARWGEHGLLNTRGELFLPDARDLPADLPQLLGPEGTETQVARLYLDTYPRLLTVGLSLSRVTLDERGAWNLELSNGVEVRLGRQDVNARLERFISAASPVIATRTGQVSYVDMRYSNGFAIGWGTGSGKSKSEIRESVAGSTSSLDARSRDVRSHGNV
jgi:hypothetical protein